MNGVVDQIPQSMYTIIGYLVVAQLTTIVGVLAWGIKSAYKHGYEKATTDLGIKDAKETAVRAHKRIDVVEAKI